ncbi:hypothetical protein VTJ04DRAFT_2571 [Mycothermus thermophilus]|uniref:uncharacterized protein n=1 Tax=Humicola insolens TaxID=85995 RepID=UPI00374398E0
MELPDPPHESTELLQPRSLPCRGGISLAVMSRGARSAVSTPVRPINSDFVCPFPPRKLQENKSPYPF